jgi:hypothetical protein
MEKLRFQAGLAGLLVLIMMFSSCASLDTLQRSEGLILYGLDDFDGYFVIAIGAADDTTFFAGTATLDGVNISNGQAQMTVYGDGTTPFGGNAVVQFDVDIREHPDVKSRAVGKATVTVSFKAGSAIGTVSQITDLRTSAFGSYRRPSLPFREPLVTVRS